MLLNRALFDLPLYDKLKAFFATVQTGDEAQTVLQRAEAKVPPKPN